VRAFLIEEQKIVKRVLQAQAKAKAAPAPKAPAAKAPAKQTKA